MNLIGFKLVFVLLLHQIAAATHGDGGSDETETMGVCENAADGIFGKEFYCECTIVSPLRGEYELFCARDNICFGTVVCGSITWTGYFYALTGGEASQTVCIANIAWDLPPITANPDDLCISYEFNTVNFIRSIYDRICPDGLRACLGLRRRNDSNSTTVDNTTAVVSASNQLQNAAITSCNVTISGSYCNSCTPCDSKGGAIFDCSNIIDGFVSTECVPFRPMLGERMKVTKQLDY